MESMGLGAGWCVDFPGKLNWTNNIREPLHLNRIVQNLLGENVLHRLWRPILYMVYGLRIVAEPEPEEYTPVLAEGLHLSNIQ